MDCLWLYWRRGLGPCGRGVEMRCSNWMLCHAAASAIAQRLEGAGIARLVDQRLGKHAVSQVGVERG